MLTLGRSGDEKLAERFARALAAELRAVGISLDYTPVLDILTNPKNPVIGDRALAEHADDVARLGRSIIRTLQEEGIAACGKHFPGHGDTSADSHHELPIVEHPPDRIERASSSCRSGPQSTRGRRVDHDRAHPHSGARRGTSRNALAGHGRRHA